MGRLFGGYYSTEDVADFGSGAIVASAPETAILKNINWLHARMVPTLAVDVFGFEAGDPWLDVSTGNDSAITIVATYRIRVPKDFATYRIKVRCKNAHASSAGTLAAGLSSNGASVTTAIAAGSTGATLSMDLAINRQRDDQHRDPKRIFGLCGRVLHSERERVRGAAHVATDSRQVYAGIHTAGHGRRCHRAGECADEHPF